MQNEDKRTDGEKREEEEVLRRVYSAARSIIRRKGVRSSELVEELVQIAVCRAWHSAKRKGVPVHVCLKFEVLHALGNSAFAPGDAHRTGTDILRGPTRHNRQATAPDGRVLYGMKRLPFPEVLSLSRSGTLNNETTPLCADHVPEVIHKLDCSKWRETLSPFLRQVFDLRRASYTYRQIARVLGVGPDRALAALQTLKQIIPPALLVRPCKSKGGGR